MQATTAIQIENLRKSFGDNNVLRGVNLTVRKGENVVVLGRSGSGKSVLIKCAVRLIPADEGNVKVLGENIEVLGNEELDIMRQRIGFLFQSSALYDSMTVRENLEFPLRRTLIRKDKRTMQTRVEEALQNVGLSHAINLMPSELSGGMRKRIGLARTLIMQPEIMLYDEPTTGLDPITAREITDLMLKIQSLYNTSSIIISHDMNCVKAVNARIVMLINGINYAEGYYHQLAQSKDPKIRSFFE